MKLIICNNCKSAFSVSAIVKKCDCGQTNAREKEGVVLYAGDASCYEVVETDNGVDRGMTWREHLSAQRVKDKKSVHSAQDREFCTKVIEYLNQKAGTRFSTKFPSAITQLILSRRSEENCGLEDFFNVIDKKTQAWVGTDFEMYLRPATLFSKAKFSNYLGEKTTAKAKQTSTDRLFDAGDSARAHLIGSGKGG